MAIEIEVQTPYDTKVGAGPIITGRNWRSSPRMNKIGAFSFEMPLNDPRRSYLVQKRYVRCYGMVDGTRTELGKPGIIDAVVKEMDANGVPTGMLRVSGRDLLAELADINIHELSLIDTSARIPDVVQYYDGTASAYIDMTDTYDDNPATSVEIPADDEDWHYIGDADPWDVTTWDLGANLNDDRANFKVQYSTGVENAFSAGTILSDTTKVENASFGQDGSIRWERQEDWATQTNNGVDDMYWLRYRYGEDMSGDVTINEITITQDIPTTAALADWLAYTDAAAGNPISDLGWDFWATHQATENTVFLILRDVSAFEALTLIAEQTGENFRLGTGRLIDWLQNDKTASGIRATNVSDGIVAEDNEDICLITNLRETEDSYELISRVYPQGGGRGSTRVTLLECTQSAPAGYTLSKSANYLKKDSVEVDYGRRLEATKFWPGLASPREGSSRDANSSDGLYKLAYEYLERHCTPQKSYIFSVVKLDAAVEIGETIQLVYWQTVEGTAVWNLGITAALHLWVLEVTHAVDDAGTRVVAMQVATIDAWPSSDAGKVKSIVSYIKAIQSTDGPVGAGSLTPSSVADLVGSLDLSAYYQKPTGDNVILGLDAGDLLTTGDDTVLIGNATGDALTTGEDNVAVGYNALGAGNPSFCVAIGFQALLAVGTTSDGDENVGVGYSALADMDTGEYNTALGSQAMGTNTEGDYNVAVGMQAMDIGAGSQDIAIGYQSLRSTTAVTGYDIAIGYKAAYNITSGVDNIAIGRQAMGGSTTPSNNTVIGASAGYDGSITTYADCVIIGFEAGAGLDSGDGNVLVGYQAGIALTTGTLNVFIGKLAGSQETTGSNKLYIENTNSATPLIYGEFDNDLVRINGNLDVTGNITMATTKFIGITGNEIITFQAAGTIDFTGADVTMDNDLAVTNDILLSDGSVIGITGNEVITFNAAGTIIVTGAKLGVADTPATAIHASDGGGTNLTGIAVGGMAITDATIPSLYLEDTGEAEDKKVFRLTNWGQALRIQVLDDVGTGLADGGAVVTITRAGAVTAHYGLNLGAATGAAAGNAWGASAVASEPVWEIRNTHGLGSSGALRFYKDGGSPADNDQMGAMLFYGKDSGDNETLYGGIYGVSIDVTDGTEDGQLAFYSTANNAYTLTAWFESGLVFNAANSVDWDQVSDKILKHHVIRVSEALVSLHLLEPIEFQFNEKYHEINPTAALSQVHIGFTAQNFAKVFPQQVSKAGKYKSMNSGGLDALLVAGVQELDGYRIVAEAERGAIRERLLALETP